MLSMLIQQLLEFRVVNARYTRESSSSWFIRNLDKGSGSAYHLWAARASDKKYNIFRPAMLQMLLENE